MRLPLPTDDTVLLLDDAGRLPATRDDVVDAAVERDLTALQFWVAGLPGNWSNAISNLAPLPDMEMLFASPVVWRGQSITVVSLTVNTDRRLFWLYTATLPFTPEIGMRVSYSESSQTFHISMQRQAGQGGQSMERGRTLQ